MNFLIFSTDYKPQAGGIAEHCHNIAKALNEHAHNVTVLTVLKNGCRHFDREQPFKTFRVANLLFLRNLIFLSYLLFLYLKRRVDVIYCGITHPCAEISFLFSLCFPVKVVVAVHGYEVVYSGNTARGRIKNILRSVRTFIYNRSHRVIAVSNYTRDQLIDSGVNPEKIAVVPNAVDAEVFKPGERHAAIVQKYGLSHKKIILTVGAHTERKGHDVVIKALPAVLSELPEVVYLVAGDGPRKDYLMTLAAEMNLRNNVVFLGYVSADDLIKLYNTCDVFIMVSRTVGSSVEGFGIVFLEANACGKPVIGGRSGGISDAIIDGETGLLVDPENPEEVSAVLLRLLTDREFSERLGRSGYERVQREFTWNRIVPVMVNNLKDLPDITKSRFEPELSDIAFYSEKQPDG